MSYDYAAKRVLVEVEFYPSEDSSKRVTAEIDFEGVTHASKIVNFERLENNFSAGNINYWRPSEGGVTYIYLADGCIQISCRKISIRLGE